MTEPQPPELFSERPIRSDFARNSGMGRAGPSYALRRIFTLAVIAFLIGGSLYWKLGNHGPEAPEAIPTIKAEGAYKQRPDQPGGIDIPNQDIQAYNALDNKPPPQNEVEHLLPPPEVPESNTVPMPSSSAAPIITPVDNGSDAIHVESLAPETAPSPSALPLPRGSSSLPISAKVATTATTVTPINSKPELPPLKLLTTASQAAVTSTPPVQPQITINHVLTPVAPPAKTDIVVQVASVPDPNNAQTIMQKVQVKYASLLGATALRVVKADLGAKGIYYRVQSPPLTESRAKSICAALKNDNAGCFIVRP